MPAPASPHACGGPPPSTGPPPQPRSSRRTTVPASAGKGQRLPCPRTKSGRAPPQAWSSHPVTRGLGQAQLSPPRPVPTRETPSSARSPREDAGGRGSPQKPPSPPSATTLPHPVCEDLRGWPQPPRPPRTWSGPGRGWDGGPTCRRRASEGRADWGGARAMATPTRGGEARRAAAGLSGARFPGRHSTCSNVPATGSRAGRRVPRGHRCEPGPGLRLCKDHGVAEGAAGRRHDPVRHSGMDELALQAGISPATHAHPPPPAPHRVLTQQAGGRHPRCTRQVPWVWRGPSRGGHLGGLPVGRGVQAPPARQVQQPARLCAGR